MGCAAVAELSRKTAEYMIAAWKRARLNAGEHSLNYPKTNVLHPTYGVGTGGRDPELGLSDADKVQRAVDSMHAGMRAIFETWQLGLIGGVNYRDKTQRQRAKQLGVSWHIYLRRYNSAVQYVQNHVEP